MKDTRLAEVYNTSLWFVLNLHVYFYEIMLQKKDSHERTSLKSKQHECLI